MSHVFWLLELSEPEISRHFPDEKSIRFKELFSL